MDESYLAFVASPSESDENGIYSYRVDATTGELARVAATPAGENPSFLTVHPSREYLYAVDGVDDGTALAFSIDRETGTLTELNRESSGDAGPCYCSVDTAGRYLLIAHYSGGSVSMVPIGANGRLGEPTDVIVHEESNAGPDQQTQPRPHSIVPGPENRFAYVPDLGTDRVVVYEIDGENGKLQPVVSHHVGLHEGAGPRHFDIHPDDRFAYLLNERDSTLTAFERDADAGTLVEIETVSTLPTGFDGYNATADVHVHSSGQWLYASNRGQDSIAVFEIDGESGCPRLVDHQSTRGEWPRNFALDPAGNFLFAENKDTNDIVVFRIDEETGQLAYAGETRDVPQPMCMAFLPTE